VHIYTHKYVYDHIHDHTYIHIYAYIQEFLCKRSYSSYKYTDTHQLQEQSQAGANQVRAISHSLPACPVDMTHWNVWHDSWRCFAWCIDVRDISLFICATRRIYKQKHIRVYISMQIHVRTNDYTQIRIDLYMCIYIYIYIYICIYIYVFICI